jgi:hypothetical protein
MRLGVAACLSAYYPLFVADPAKSNAVLRLTAEGKRSHRGIGVAGKKGRVSQRRTRADTVLKRRDSA